MENINNYDGTNDKANNFDTAVIDGTRSRSIDADVEINHNSTSNSNNICNNDSVHNEAVVKVENSAYEFLPSGENIDDADVDASGNKVRVTIKISVKISHLCDYAKYFLETAHFSTTKYRLF